MVNLLNDAHTVDVWRRPRTWIVAGVIFLALGVVNGLGIFAQVLQYEEARPGEALRFALLRMLPFWMYAFLLLPVIVWLTRRYPPLGPGWGRNVAIHLAAAFPVTWVRLGLGYSTAYVLTPPQTGDLVFGTFVGNGIISASASSVTLYLSAVGAVLAVDHYFESRARERQAARAELRAAHLETTLERARLDSLRSQLDPHFLFNALNSVSTLARQGRAQSVVAALGTLGDLLRATLDRNRPMSTLDEELTFLNLYLDIERMRLGDRVSISIEVTEACRRARLPALILQPLVENALKHGAGGTRGHVAVEVLGEVEGTRLRLRVRDTGRGFPDAWTEGVGLGNTLRRIEQTYGAEGALDVDSTEAGTTITVTLPYDTVPADTDARDFERAGTLA